MVNTAKEEFRLAKKRRNERIIKERRVRSIEAEIESLESEIAEIEASMEACGTEYEKLHRIQTEKNILNQRIDVLFEEWEVLRE